MGLLLSLIIGYAYNIPVLVLGAEIGFWLAAVIGTIIAIGYLIYDSHQKSNFDKIWIYAYDGNEKIDNIDHPDRTFIFHKNVLQKIADGSVPYKVDLLYDIIVSFILVYYDYSWLTIFYLVHMYGIYEMKRRATNLLNGPYWDRKGNHNEN